MAKRKATAGKRKRAKTTKKKALRKKTSPRAAKRTARKKVVRKVAKKAAKKKTAKKVVRRPVKAAKAKRAVKVAPVKPKRPRRTKQALPPKKPPAPPPVMEVEPVGPAPVAPPGVTAPPVEAEVLEAAPRPMPAVGDMAPDVQLADETGQMHSLAQYRGKRVVLYFYPKDDTPGCTAEACGFRNSLGAFTERNAVVLGISPDSVESHQRFAQKYGLTFPLLADVGHKVAESYGVWVEKERLGEKKMGVARTTFVINTDGRIAHVLRDVRPDGHDGEVLQHLPL